jgi:hypothetical protein
VNRIAPAMAMALLLGGITEAATAHPVLPQSSRVAPVVLTGPTSPRTPAPDGSYGPAGEQQYGNSSDAVEAFWGNAQRNGH